MQWGAWLACWDEMEDSVCATAEFKLAKPLDYSAKCAPQQILRLPESAFQQLADSQKPAKNQLISESITR